MALGILLIAFIVMCVVSGVGFVLLFLLKNERVKKIIFYVLSVWGMGMAALGAMCLPSNYVPAQLISWGFGFLSVAGLLVHIKAKSRTQIGIAYLLVLASIVLGIMKLFGLY